MNPGDLVITRLGFGELQFIGVVLEIRPMENIYKDSNRGERMNSVTVLWDKEVPRYLGQGRICDLPDTMLQVINEG